MESAFRLTTSILILAGTLIIGCKPDEPAKPSNTYNVGGEVGGQWPYYWDVQPGLDSDAIEQNTPALLEPDTSCQDNPFIIGYVLTECNNEPVENVVMSLTEGTAGKRILRAITDANGYFYFCGDEDSIYYDLYLRWLPDSLFFGDPILTSGCKTSTFCTWQYCTAFCRYRYPGNGNWKNGDIVYVKPLDLFTVVLKPSETNRELVSVDLLGDYFENEHEKDIVRYFANTRVNQKEFSFTIKGTANAAYYLSYSYNLHEGDSWTRKNVEHEFFLDCNPADTLMIEY